MSKVPEGFHAVTPSIVVSDGNAALALYGAALDAQELHRLLTPGSDKIMHACFAIGDPNIFLYDENPAMHLTAPRPGEGSSFYVYVDDVDAQHAQAVAAGMTEVSAPADMFWGDRMSVLADPYGHKWQLAAHVRDVSEAEMKKAMESMGGRRRPASSAAALSPRR